MARGTAKERRGKALVMQDLTRSGHARGRIAEAMVLDSLTRLASGWPWFRGARMATRAEDRKGVDIMVATSDVGFVRVQVKSSHDKAKAFRARCSGPIAIIVASVATVDLDRRVRLAIDSARHLMMSERNVT